MRPALLRAPSAQPSRYERRRPEQTPLYLLVQQHYLLDDSGAAVRSVNEHPDLGLLILIGVVQLTVCGPGDRVPFGEKWCLKILCAVQ